MAFQKEEYYPRLVDKTIEDYLEVFGAISVEGPKWCGKTWSSSNHAKSIVYLDDEKTRDRAELDLELILNEEMPELIDEWHLVPKIWDRVRRKCDENSQNGKYILTCSTELNDEKKKDIYHSGAGRLGKILMYPMSLYESKDSTGEASLQDMLNGKQKNRNVKVPGLKEIAHLIVRGGWPKNINVSSDKIGIIPKSYIESILDKDIHDDKQRNKDKMRMLLKSLARNESTIVNNQTLIKDIFEYADSNELLNSRVTLEDYLDVLNRLYLLNYQDAYSSNYRSKSRVGKSAKRHFVDPSLACACLNVNADKLLKDLKTFGFLFESLVIRDLNIYMEYLGGHLYHFRDNVSGLEVDAILEFENGDYAAVEIKLGQNQKEEATASLLKFYDEMNEKPKFMCIITSDFEMIAKDPKTGIYYLPITSLKP